MNVKCCEVAQCQSINLSVIDLVDTR